MLRMNFETRRNIRIGVGNERNAAWAKLSPQQKLAALDERLGAGVGATRQREKLAKQIAMDSQAGAPQPKAKKGK